MGPGNALPGGFFHELKINAPVSAFTLPDETFLEADV
jgi:hypothetical protein